MKSTPRRFVPRSLLIAACLVTTGPAAAQEGPSPVRMDADRMAGIGLTPVPNGRAQEFTPGDALMVPKGYTGTWEMQGNYRELAIVAQ